MTAVIAMLLPITAIPGQQLTQDALTRGNTAPSAPSAHATARPVGRPPSTAGMIVMGLVGATVGTYAGATVGLQYAQGCKEDFCELGPAVLGALIGEAVGVPIGVNIVGGRGPLGREMLTSVGVLFLGLVTAGPTYGATLLAVPAAQIWTSIRHERRAWKAGR